MLHLSLRLTAAQLDRRPAKRHVRNATIASNADPASAFFGSNEFSLGDVSRLTLWHYRKWLPQSEPPSIPMMHEMLRSTRKGRRHILSANLSPRYACPADSDLAVLSDVRLTPAFEFWRCARTRRLGSGFSRRNRPLNLCSAVPRPVWAHKYLNVAMPGDAQLAI